MIKINIFKQLTAFLALFLLFFNLQAFGQSATITGKVTGPDNLPLPGVNILIEGTNIGTVTDIDGNYSVEISDPNSSLVYSYVGYIPQTVAVAGKTKIDVVLAEDVVAGEEIVVIGYGTQKKSDLTGAVAVVNTENLEKIQSNNIAKVLQGQTSGVQVFGAGEPGAIPKVQIRGVGTFGNTDPLYVVDGVPIAGPTNINVSGQSMLFENHAPGYGSSSPTGGITDFNPSDIESVQILKDASAAAIYGARGANGVIIITTKRGKEGKAAIEYQGSYGIQNIAKRMDLTDRVKFQELHNQARANDRGKPAPVNDPENEKFIDDIDTDWQKEALTTGRITNHSISLRSGDEISSYYASVNYFDQTGTMIGPGPRYTKYSAQLNLDQKKGRLKLSESLTYSSSEQIRLTSTRWNNIMSELVMAIPTVPIYDTANIGGYGGGSPDYIQIAGNPIAFNNLAEVNFKRHRFFGVVSAELEIFKSLKYKINLSYDRSEWFNSEFIPVYEVGDRHTWDIPQLNQWRGENPVMIMENLLNFNKVVGKHNMGFVLGYTAQKDHIQDLYAHSEWDEGFEGPYLKVISGVSSGQSSLGKRYEHAMLSYLGRLDYNYSDRYLLTASMRRDYSSNFGPNNKFGDFPSFALGWKLSNEQFFDVAFINLLKFRGGWGKIGNENIGAYLYETTVNNAVNYIFDGKLTGGTIQTRAIDPSIRWEERITANFGFDLAMMSNKVELSAEYYHNTANDILMGFPLPISSGAIGWQIDQANGASMVNKGVEVNASYRKLEGDLHYEVSGNFTTLQNEITKIGTSDIPVQTNTSITEVGGSMGQLYGWVFEGIFQDESEINTVNPSNDTFDETKHAFQHTQTKRGDVMFKDINEDGLIDDNDKTYLGSVFPKFTYGINASLDYKGIDVSVFFRGIKGNKVYNEMYRLMNTLSEGNYSIESYENYYTEERPSTTWPRPTVNDYNGNNRASDRWVQDGSYLKLQNLQIGYTLPGKAMDKLKGVDNIRVYVQGQNLLTFTKMVTFDPDFINDGLFNRGYAGGSFPSPRTLSVGVKLGL